MWGAIGGFIGAATKLPLDELTARVPARLKTVFAAVLATLRPLSVVLVTCTAIALVGWMVQVGADVGGVRSDRSVAVALFEEAAFVVEDGIHLTALAAGARFRADANGPLGLPFPVADANDVPGRGGAFRIFNYDDAIPAYVLLPALVFLMGLVALGALYAGFAAARTVKARSLGTGAAWGVITGPAWAITMALLVILAGGLFHGDADDASVFGVFLLGGGLLGAGVGRSRSAAGRHRRTASVARPRSHSSGRETRPGDLPPGSRRRRHRVGLRARRPRRPARAGRLREAVPQPGRPVRRAARRLQLPQAPGRHRQRTRRRPLDPARQHPRRRRVRVLERDAEVSGRLRRRLRRRRDGALRARRRDRARARTGADARRRARLPCPHRDDGPDVRASARAGVLLDVAAGDRLRVHFAKPP